jgi:RsiW-degrading membrane proteinase PrsW (M82 family)
VTVKPGRLPRLVTPALPTLDRLSSLLPFVSRPALLALRIVVAAGLVLCSAGCGVHPAGTNDVSLTYRAAEPTPKLESLVRARLAAAQIVANVEPTDDGVQIEVDRDESGSVDAILSWRGGLSLYELAPDAALFADPGGLEGLTPKSETHPDGVLETYYEGAPNAVAQAVRQAAPPPGVKALVRNLGPGRARTLLVHDPARVDLTDAVARSVADGRTLEVTFSPYGEKEIDRASRALGANPVAVVRDRTALQVGPIASGTLRITLGEDLAAFASARALAAILASPPLPALARTSATRVPTDWPLVIAGTGIPFLLSLAWLFFVRRFDRAQPEPWWLVLATFFLGCLSVIPAALAELGWMRASEWLDPSLVTMGGAIASVPIALPVFALVIGLSEEGSKFLGAWSLAYHRKEFDEPIDGIVYGASSALGFAAVENVKYFAVGRMTPALIVVRMFMSVPAHLFFGAIWGYALGRTLVAPKTRVIAYLALAALAHGAFDTFLSYGPLTAIAFALNLAMATVFVLLLRQSLRHGIVTPATSAVDPSRRYLFVVGSTPEFLVSAAALHIIAALLFLSSAYAAGAQTRVGLLFVLGMSSLVALLGVAAYFLSATMPLDAVLDNHGVTFAGATRSWRSIRSVEPSPRGLHVRSTEGDVWIGPAGGDAIAPIARAITHHLERIGLAG